MSLELTRENLKELFRRFDIDNNGGLSLNELKNALCSYRYQMRANVNQTKPIILLLALADKVEYGGEASFEQFCDMTETLNELESLDSTMDVMIRELFKIYDKDGDEKISGSEVSRIQSFLGMGGDCLQLDFDYDENAQVLDIEKFREYIFCISNQNPGTDRQISVDSIASLSPRTSTNRR